MAKMILIVDDEPEVRATARDALVALGYTVLETGDPQHALRLARQQPIDLLITDVVMPLMKGMDLADRIQAVRGSTRVLAMSGYHTVESAHTGRAFLSKPFRLDTLAAAVRETLTRPSAFAKPQPQGGPDGPAR